MVAQDRLDPAVVAALAPNYRILSVLEPSGLGNVFLAEDTRAGDRRVALKVFHRPLSDDPEFASRLLERAAASQRVRHPHVVETYDSGRAADGTLYVAMELVDGRTLAEYLRAHPRMALVEVVEIVTQCAEALHAAHEAGIIHRNVKPLNILLGPGDGGRPRAKIRDFSIAKVKEVEHTATGSLLGTPAYMSYEQVSGLAADQLDGRADLYSLALVAYEMLAGRPAFAAATAVATLMEHLNAPTPAVRAERPDVPSEVEAVLLRALDKDREQRYASAREFGLALREAVGLPTEVAATAAEPTPDPGAATQPAETATADVAAAETVAAEAAAIEASTVDAPAAPDTPEVPPRAFPPPWRRRATAPA
jgi:serine/threonine-protein kinase